ncbi:MAG TPA: hypothetical protein VJ600_03035 [Holophagaceae bacterium]|nr:hypothetical protein [Holophagaceae bacterium]
MKLRFALIPTVAMVALSSIGCHQADPIEVRQLRWLEKADPIADAKVALVRGDHRLRAVRGFVVSIPGTDGKDFEFFKQTYGIDEIAGTSDDLVNAEHHRLVGLAYKYAETYNRQIRSHYRPQDQLGLP